MKRSHLGVPMTVFKSELKLVFAVKDPVNCLPQKVKDQKVQQYALMWRIRMILMCSVHLTHAFVWVCLHVWMREKEGTSKFEKEKISSVCVCMCESRGVQDLPADIRIICWPMYTMKNIYVLFVCSLGGTTCLCEDWWLQTNKWTVKLSSALGYNVNNAF